MARSASILAAIYFALIAVAFVVFTAIYLVSSPFVVTTAVRMTQSSSSLPLAERVYVGSLTSQNVRSAKRSIELVEYYRQDEASGPESIGHLLDVRDSFVKVWTGWVASSITLVSALIIVWWRQAGTWLRMSLRIAAGLCISFTSAIGIVVLFAFDSLFTFLHEIIFPQGNWQFPPDSLLVQVFPTPFWVIMMSLLLLFVFVAGVLIAFGTLTRVSQSFFPAHDNAFYL